MGKFTLLLGAAGAAFILATFALPGVLAVAPAAIAAPAPVQVVPAQPGMADLFQEEKARARQHPLPDQF